MTTHERVLIRHLDKTFGDTRVLRGVDLGVEAGEVHGLAGQNGSGKSTIVKILTGVHHPDPGAELLIDGTRLRLPVRWKDVHASGVSVVHQDLGLLDELSVADNICIGGFPRHPLTRQVDRRRQRALARRALDRIGADLDPDRPTSTLDAPERAEVAIARALRDHTPGAGLVIMDESTRSLAGSDLARIHRVLRSLVAEGTSVVMISHSLPELLAVSDRVTVLRDGVVTGAGIPVAELTEQELARRMLGATASVAELTARRPATTARRTSPDVAAAVVHDLAGRRVEGVSFTVGRGEVVGITGLPGSGYEDIPYLLTGAAAARSGRLRVGAATLDLTRGRIAGFLRAGVVLVPEQRVKHGLAVELSVRDNLTLPDLDGHGSRWFLSRAWQQRDADQAVQRFGIRPADPDRLVKTLSGGNQQKVLLAKWLGVSPSLLVLHEPTQAVDVGARRDILAAIRRAADDGVAVVLVSGQPSDLVAVCDRILVARAGALEAIDAGTADDVLDHVYRSGLDTKAG